MKRKQLFGVLLILILSLLILPAQYLMAATTPTVNGLAPTSITATSAVIGGVVTNDNGYPITERGFYWGLGGTNPYPGGTKLVISGTGSSVINQNYYYSLDALNSNTQYSFVAYATNANGTTVSPLRSFTTLKDSVPPTIIGYKMANNNAYVDVYFSEYVYRKGHKAVQLQFFKTQFNQNGGTATSATVTSITKTNGTSIRNQDKVSVVRFNLSISGTPSGLETFQIWPASSTAIYDASGNAMASTQTTGLMPFNDPISPKIVSGKLAGDNSYIDIAMSTGVYGPGKSALTISQLGLTFTPDPMGDGATAVSIISLKNTNNGALAGGETTIRVYLNITGIPDGYEYIELHPASGSSIYNGSGVAMSSSQTTGYIQLNDKSAPVIISGSLATDNSYVDVAFDHEIYGPSGTAATISNFDCYFSQNGGNATAAVISSVTKTDGTALTGGETVVRVYLTTTGTPSGIETIAVFPYDGFSLYDINGNAMTTSQTTGALLYHDKLPPAITTTALDTANSYVDINFSEGICNASKNGLSVGDLKLVFSQNGGTSSAVVLTGVSRSDGTALSGGETAVRVQISVTGTPNGLETISISPYSTTSIYDLAGNAMAATQTTGALYLKDKYPPLFTSAALAATNAYIDVTFNEGIYHTGTTALLPADLALTFAQNGGTATNCAITTLTTTTGTALVGGETTIRVNLSVTGIPTGKETITLYPASASSVYDKARNAMLATQNTGAYRLSDKTPPTIASGTLAINNTYLDVAFSEGVYHSGGSALLLSDIRYVFTRNGGTCTGVTLTSIKKTDASALTGGETVVRIYLTTTGTPNGVETIAIYPNTGTSTYDSNGNAMLSTATTGNLKFYNTTTLTISGGTVGSTNQYVDVDFSKPCYGPSSKAIAVANLKLTFIQNGGTATSAVISTVTRTDGTALVGGETTIRVVLSVSGTASGAETVALGPASGTSLYDSLGNAMASTATTGNLNLHDRVLPVISSGSIASNNAYIDVIFSKGIYGPGKSPVISSNLKLTFTQNSGTVSSVTINSLSKTDGSPLTGGETTIRVSLFIVGTPSGVETVSIAPSGSTSLYDASGNAMLATATTGNLKLYDTLAPYLVSSALDSNNQYVTIVFNEALYGTGKTALAPANLLLTFTPNGGSATAAVINSLTRTDGSPLTGGETSVRVLLGITGTPSGVETVMISPSSLGAIVDGSSNAMLTSINTGYLKLNDKQLPIITSAVLESTNQYLDVSFNESVFGSGLAAVNVSNLHLSFNQNGGMASAVSICGLTSTSGDPLSGGEKTIRVCLIITGSPSGVETIAITPSSGASLYDSTGNAMLSTATTGNIRLHDSGAPYISGATMDSKNQFVSIDFNEGIYGFAKSALTAGNLYLTFTKNDGTATAVSIASLKRIDDSNLVGGETTIRVYLNITGVPSGVETVEIAPTSISSVFDGSGNAMSASQSTGPLKLYDVSLPTITGGSLDSNNTYVEIAFSKPIYGPGTTAVSAGNLKVTFTQNGGSATAATITGVYKTDGTALQGGETAIRVMISLTGAPNGNETIALGPASASSLYDKAGNAMQATQTTGNLLFNYKSPIQSLIHNVKTANNRTPTNIDKTFIPGDYVPLSVQVKFSGSAVNPVIVIDLSSASNSDFSLKEITTGSGAIDNSTVHVYKNGAAMDISKISYNRTGNLLKISINESWAISDTLTADYFTQLKLNAAANQKGAKPHYGDILTLDAHLEWGSPVNTYSSTNPGPTGTDQFTAQVITGNPGLLQ